MKRRARRPAAAAAPKPNQLVNTIAALETRAEFLERELTRTREAAALLRDVVSAQEIADAAAAVRTRTTPPARRKAGGRKPRRAPKPRPLKSKRRARKAAPATKTAATKRLAPDEPRVAKGRLPTKGVEKHACTDQADRKARVEKLRAEGYQRVAGGVPLSPGSFDVREDDSFGVILWRPKAEG